MYSASLNMVIIISCSGSSYFSLIYQRLFLIPQTGFEVMLHFKIESVPGAVDIQTKASKLLSELGMVPNSEKTENMSKIKKIYGNLPLRVSYRSKRGRNGARILIKCGCCNQSLEIYPADDPKNFPLSESIEINGVNGSVAQWRELLCPLMGMKDPTTK